jgi:hypothetical protein
MGHPENLTDPSHEELFTKGIHRAHYANLKEAKRTASETDAYFFHPNELKELFEDKGVRTLTLATCQGLSSFLYEATNTLYKDREKWRRWLEILLKTCTDPCIIGSGNHLLYVGRKEEKARSPYTYRSEQGLCGRTATPAPKNSDLIEQILLAKRLHWLFLRETLLSANFRLD